MDDMVLLAHIREQYRLSLESYGRPRMTKELQELSLNVGHPSPAGQWMRDNGIKIIRTQKYKVRRVKNLIWGIKFTDARRTAITRSTSRLICWIRISQLMAPTKNGLETSATSGPAKAGCIWPLSLIYSLAASSVGPLSSILRIDCPVARQHMQSMCERGQRYSNWMKRDLAIRALDMAVALRQPPKDCIHHTDRGGNICPTRSNEACPSMGSRSQ
jgi:putative transposase